MRRSETFQDLDGVEVFDEFVCIPMSRIMHCDFHSTRDIEVYLLDILDEGAEQGILPVAFAVAVDFLHWFPSLFLCSCS